MPKINQSGAQTRRTAMPSDGGRVMKDLSSEEMQILTSMQSELSQILSMSGGGAQGAQPAAPAAPGNPQAVQMGDQTRDRAVGGSKVVGPIFDPGSPQPSRVEGEEEEEDEEAAVVRDEEEDDDGDDDTFPERMQGAPANAAPNPARTVKAIIVGDPDASTGSGKADERIEDLPEYEDSNLGGPGVGDEGIDTIVKSILRMAFGKNIKKSQQINPLTSALVSVTKALRQIADQQNMQQKVLTDMLDGLGVTKALERQTRAPRRAVGTMPADTDHVVKELARALSMVSKGQGGSSTSVGEEGALSPSERVRKNLRGLTRGMAEIAGDLWNPNIGPDEQ